MLAVENRSKKYSFPIIRDKTFELIKQASVVVSHDSTALTCAIIMRKPIIMVTTEELYNSNRDRLAIEKFAFLLGKEVVNLNRIPKIFDWKNQLLVDEKKFKPQILVRLSNLILIDWVELQ